MSHTCMAYLTTYPIYMTMMCVDDYIVIVMVEITTQASYIVRTLSQKNVAEVLVGPYVYCNVHIGLNETS